jgi:selenophosphate synthase
MSEDFWRLVEEYQQLGFDPIRWVPTCSNEVDNHILECSLKGIKRTNIKLTPSWFDTFYYMDGKIPELTRRVYNFDNPLVEKEVEIRRALSIFRIHTVLAYNSALLSGAIQNFFKNFRSRVFIRKNIMALTTHREAQFALLDYIELHRGDKVGYTSANNSVTQITDPTRKPESEIHSNIALTAGMEYLNLLGCTSGFKLFPVYDAPTEEMLDKIRTNLDAFTSRYNIGMEDYSSIKIGNLFFGTTAIANTVKELPTRYDQVEEGMQIIISNKMGALPALSLYTLTQMDNNNITKFERNGISLDILDAAKDDTIKNLSEPHFSLGKIISKYCPDFGMAYDKHMHITAVHPVMTDGFFAIVKLAKLTNSHIVISELPMKYEEIAKFATRELLIENSTAASNGCHLIVASNDVARLVVDDLRRHNFEPTIIGYFSKKEKPAVTTEKDIVQYIASKSKLARLNTLVQTEGHHLH